ncbi:hypothetical protein EIP91_007713 [Steccherinum ochraceum]|uniref:DUF4238 domain-containing protein n=1 Tax=Steccherinum ochraceum TaxID=92696 RepID=A0A4R0R3V3_9APHY|nr:hypothetical protein EIP91_007713 [Steccherinum ochraceum]
MPPKPKVQYHHYVPRFMLRKWKVEYTPPSLDPSPDPSTGHQSPSRQGKRGGRGRRRSGPGGKGNSKAEDYVQAYNVLANVIHVGTPISRVFGNVDMYKNEDESDANVFRIEELFSKLESQAAQILQKLDKAISDAYATTTITLTRKEVNTLQKFLFLMSYRSEYRAAQYLEERFDPMTKKEVDAFKKKEGLKNSYAVFLHNLRNFLESDNWKILDNEHILKSDRDSYILEFYDGHLALFIAPDDVEFIITDDGLGLNEGTILPTLASLQREESPGHAPGGPNWIHTTTYPVSPRLLVMFRSNTMISPQMLMEAGVSREKAARIPCVYGDIIPDNSYFKDFPRTLPSVHYVPPIEGSERSALFFNQRELERRVDDILTFQLHMLSTRQALRANALVLENSPSWIIFKSPGKLMETMRDFESKAGETTQGSGNWSPSDRGPVYERPSTLEYFIEHGSPPPLIAPTRPQPNASTDNDIASTSSRPSVPRSVTTALDRAQDPSFHDMLRARTDPSSVQKPLSPTSHKRKTEAWAKLSAQTPPTVKARNPVLRRKVYDVPEHVWMLQCALLLNFPADVIGDPDLLLAGAFAGIR